MKQMSRRGTGNGQGTTGVMSLSCLATVALCNLPHAGQICGLMPPGHSPRLARLPRRAKSFGGKS
jgi:hypothetical protein